jgi:hypothetical protein
VEVNHVAKVIEASDPHAAWATMSMATLARIFLYGLIVATVTALLYIVLQKFVFEPILCRESAALARCANSDDFASGVAIVFGSMVGLVFLVRERVYRPMLALIGVAISLWTIFSLVAVLPAVLAAAVIVMLFGLAYVLFSWLVQPTSLLISIASVVGVVALIRIALSI